MTVQRFSNYDEYRERYWKEARNMRIPKSGHSIPPTTNERYLQMFNNSLRIRTYLHRNLREILKDLSLEDQSVVVALFGRKSKCMLDWWGDDSLKRELIADGIDLKSTWLTTAIGPNAISVGLLEGRPMSSIGEDNYTENLHKYALYFSPASVSYLDPKAGQSNYGLALFARKKEKYNNDYQMAITSIAYGLMMTLHMNQVCQKIYRMISSGFFGLDSRLIGDENSVVIAFHDQKITEILGIPNADYSFCRLDTIIDPLPANNEFWKILKNGEDVKDWHLPLSCRGITKNYIITLVNLSQPGIGANGSYLQITTQQRQTKDISKRIGGSAVLQMDDIIGKSPAMISAKSRANLLAQTDRNVILLGESGVGKDVFAQAIHNASRRANGPFIAVNCGALPRELIASELFGYVGGSFTGAKREGNIGKFELANGGTLFLDEIGELPYDLQATLLRAVEQKQLTRLGGSEIINVDVKIISATNEDLPSMIEQHKFREDLYFRLSSMFIQIPPLRARGYDIILLAEHFASKSSSRMGYSYAPVLTPEAKSFLMSLPWKGNVRELQNLIENVVQLYHTEMITVEQLHENISTYQLGYSQTPEAPQAATTVIDEEPKLNTDTASEQAPLPVPPVLVNRSDYLTDEIITEALKKCNGNRSKAAKLLGVSRATFYRHFQNPKSDH